LFPDGRRQELDRKHSFKELYPLVGHDLFEPINLRDGHYMLVDESAYLRKEQPKPNFEATRLYHGICHPGTTHLILGTVVICPEEDLN
jgi:hypothetical protein